MNWNVFKDNVYNENYAGDENYLLDLSGIQRVSFQNEQFVNNGNWFYEAYQLYSYPYAAIQVQEYQIFPEIAVNSELTYPSAWVKKYLHYMI